MFEPFRLSLIIFGTVLIFLWLFTYRDKEVRIFFLFFTSMYLIYSGIGGALEDVTSTYTIYYFIFTCCISLGIYIGLKSKCGQKVSHSLWSKFFDYFLDKYANKIIIFYYVLLLSQLIYPENKLIHLIIPPSPDVISMLRERYQSDGMDFFTIIISLIETIFYPFFLLSLYKYRKETVKLTILVLGTYYIEYCISAYLGRGSMIQALIIILAFTYFYRPKLGKIILIVCVALFPTLLIFFVQYSITRIGGTAESISGREAIEQILAQEGGYPLLFREILDLQAKYRLNYLVWLFTMPLPGLFRGGIDANLVALFSEDLLGISRESKGFYILLPGVVGESVFLLGQNLYWLNGIFYGWLMGKTYRILSRYEQLFGILIAAALCFGYTVNRAGIYGGIPFVLKILLYFYFILLLLKRKLKWQAKALMSKHTPFMN